jgi:hypothetical protein
MAEGAAILSKERRFAIAVFENGAIANRLSLASRSKAIG